MLFGALILELAALYFLSRWVSEALYSLVYLVTRSRTVTMSFLLLVTFPGTVVHELSHLFSATILGVPAGKLTLTPEIIREKDQKTGRNEDIVTKAGSVAIAHTDPIRRFAIGLSPVAGGIIILTALAYFLQDQGYTGNTGYWGYIGLGYLLFSVSNAMFSSPQDLKGSLPVIIAVTILAGLLYYVGFRIALTGAVLDLVTRIVTTLAGSLAIVIAINLTILAITRLITMGLERILGVKVTRDKGQGTSKKET
jgi:hypothetical protein